MRTLAVLSLGFALSVPAFALDFRSVSDNAVLYDAPSSKGVKHFIIARGSPVEVVLSSQSPGRPKIDLAPTGGGSGQRPESGVQPIQENWIKVRDNGGNMAWIEAHLLSSTRTLLVRVDKADIRAEANDKSTIVFSAEKNVVLDLIEAGPPGWAKVKHRDGQSGFVKSSQVWGL